MTNNQAQSQSLLTRYRPARLRDVVGQPAVVKPLMAALAAGTLARVLLLEGPSGCGKTTTARALAAALLCEHPDTWQASGITYRDACGTCGACRTIADEKDVHLDVHEVNGSRYGRVEDMRKLVDGMYTSSAMGGEKVYIIDEAHGITSASFEMLLKPLEDLPDNVRVLLLTTEPEKIGPTVTGRTVRYPVVRPTPSAIVGYLTQVASAEGWHLSEDIAKLIVEVADDRFGVRGVLAVAEKLAPYLEAGPLSTDDAREVLGLVKNQPFEEVLDAILAGDGASALRILADLRAKHTTPAVHAALARVLHARLLQATFADDKRVADVADKLLAGLQHTRFSDVWVDTQTALAAAMFTGQPTSGTPSVSPADQAVAEDVTPVKEPALDTDQMAPSVAPERLVASAARYGARVAALMKAATVVDDGAVLTIRFPSEALKRRADADPTFVAAMTAEARALARRLAIA